MNRKDFLKFGSGALMMSAMPFGARAAEKQVPEFAKGAEELPPILDDFEYGRNPALKGRYASFFIDDAIWFLRDIARMRPKSLFDHPFLKPLKEYHDRYGLKLQINLFYRTDFFYGMDEFSLHEVPDTYKAEWQANKDWLKLGFHSLQEFPDYPWLNIDGDDVRKLFGMIKGEIDRFAGEGVFTTALVPHWCPMSEAGCRAMKELGIKIMECSVGARYRYDGVRTRLPYGHAMRIEQNRKPETCLYRRLSEDTAINSSIGGYNNLTYEQARRTFGVFDYIYDKDVGIGFKELEDFQPLAAGINLYRPEDLDAAFAKVLGKEFVVYSNHEQYFYRDYLAYQPDYSKKVLKCAQILHSAGYEYLFLEDLVR